MINCQTEKISKELKKEDNKSFYTCKDNFIHDAWNSKDMQDIRKSMIAGDKIEGCSVCYMQEENGRTSNRQHSIKEWEWRLGKEKLNDRVQQAIKNDGKLDWGQNTNQVVNRFRALSSNPGVWSLLGESRIKIDSLVTVSVPNQIKPAEIVVDGERLFVGVLDGAIEILRLTPAGRSQMSAAEFIRGLPSRVGLQLG